MASNLSKSKSNSGAPRGLGVGEEEVSPVIGVAVCGSDLGESEEGVGMSEGKEMEEEEES